MNTEQNLVLAQFALHAISQRYLSTGELKLDQLERAQDYVDEALKTLFMIRKLKREGAEILSRSTRPDND